ncbi:MAG: DUF2298 domain-containing protein [Chloroflexota bacterium]|nr:DUF2298 domain-containing protein [Chloroflexota bacterium]
MSQVLLAFRWYIAIQVLGLAALPLCLRLFRHLPDRGYGVSKPLGLLLTGWAFWLLTTFGWTRNTVGGILVAVALVVIAGAFLWCHTRHQSANLPVHRSTILTTELVFALTFTAWCLVRSHMPRIQTAGGEKWMEIAFLRAILRSDTFPPHDPWLSGFAISYYYFGYLIVAMITRLATVPPSIAFNLGIATLFALTCTGAFSLVYNLIAANLDPQVPNRKSQILGGLLGPLLVAVMGNLGGLLEVLHARGVGSPAFWAWLDIRNINGPPVTFAEGSWVPTRFFWWWRASRVLQDYTPWGMEQEVIDEFPVFSFILGDMHPHVLALPFVLLAVTLALNLYVRTANNRIANGEWRIANGESRLTFDISRLTFNVSRFTFDFSRLTSHISRLAPPLSLWEFCIYAICLGGLGFLNTWDFPIYLFAVVAAYAIACLHNTQHATRFTLHVSRFTFLFISLLVTGILLYFPFWISFQSQAGGILVNLFNATRLPQFLVMFGPLFFIVTVFVAGQAWRFGVQARQVVKWTLVAALSILVALVLGLSLVVALVWLGIIPPQGAMTYLAAWLRSEPIPGLENVAGAHALISQSLLLRLLNPWTALSLIAFLAAIVLLFFRANQRTTQSPSLPITQPPNFILLLCSIGAFLVLSVEYVYLRDHFGMRMNTVFKFYFQAWVMWGVAGAYVLADLIRRRGGVGGTVVVAVSALLIAAGLIYPALAIPARAGEYGGPPTLDGAAHLAEMKPDDYAAIAWLNGNVRGAPVILEAPGDHGKAYVYEGRISAHTGLPTLLGWAGHENQWRGNYEEQARREPDIETLYTSVDPDEVLTLLEKYDASYVYVGPVERARYPAAGLAKFAGLMDAVYNTGTVTIYYR